MSTYQNFHRIHLRVAGAQVAACLAAFNRGRPRGQAFADLREAFAWHQFPSGRFLRAGDFDPGSPREDTGGFHFREQELFGLIAPFVRSGGLVEAVNQAGEPYSWRFRAGQVRLTAGRIVFAGGDGSRPRVLVEIWGGPVRVRKTAGVLVHVTDHRRRGRIPRAYRSLDGK